MPKLRVLVLRQTLSNGVPCPVCHQQHQLEDLKGARSLNEQCYFKCPGDGKEFEIVVRERIPNDLQPVDPEMNALPEMPVDEPGTMGGTEFLNEPADEPEAEESPAEEETGEEDFFAAAEEEPTDEEKDKDKKKDKEESFSSKAVRLMRRGMTAKQAVDILECGMEPTGGAPAQIVIQVQPPEAGAEVDDMDPEMDSFSYGGMAPEPMATPGFEDPGVAHGVATVESRR